MGADSGVAIIGEFTLHIYIYYIYIHYIQMDTSPDHIIPTRACVCGVKTLGNKGTCSF